MSFYTAQQTQALNNLSPLLRSSGLLLGDELEELRALIASGNLGITADAADVDAVALGGGHFSRDKDSGDGSSLVFAWRASWFHNGRQLVNVAAGNLTLSASTTNYLQVDQDGVVSKVTTGFATDGSKLPLWRVVAGAATYTDNNVFIAKPLLTWVPAGLVVGSLLSVMGRTKSIEVNLGTISATGSFALTLPANAGTIQRVSFAGTTTLAASDVDYWTFDVINKGAAGAGVTKVVDGAAAANTTKATGGSALTAYVKRALTLNGVPGTDVALDHAGEDVLQVTLTKTAAAANLVGCSLRIDSAFTG